MPKEQKKRGRREEKKRKREQVDDEAMTVPKRQKSEDREDEIKLIADGDVNGDFTSHPPAQDVDSYPGDIPFFGLLDEDEQAYFKRADTLLELNQFDSPEERELFLNSVYREANGKELKIANSQACSRTLERLILMSNPSQLKALFQKFSGHFLHLVQHRFASHCCEALFLRSAPTVTQELIAIVEDHTQDVEDGQVYVSIENLFLYTINELQGNLGYLMTDPFASHTLRVLLVVLSGRPLAGSAMTSLLRSKKKEKIDLASGASASQLDIMTTRTVPESFGTALDKMISGTIAGLDTTYLRALATHPLGNPVLQLLLELEFSKSSKQMAKDVNSLFRKLLPDDPLVQGTTSASFVTSLLYDPVGSRLLETIIQFAPGRVFKSIYKDLFREKMGSLVKNETAGFVLTRMLERLSQEDLRHAVEQICPQIPTLIERSQTSIIKIMIGRCEVRQVQTDPIADAILRGYGGERTGILPKMLKLDIDDVESMAPERKKQLEAQDTGKTHASLLAQAMLDAPGPLRKMITESMISMTTQNLLSVAKSRTATHMLQKALTCSAQTKLFLRQIVQRFQGSLSELAIDPIASHVVDTFWVATESLFFIRERFAQELLEHESALKESFSGRAVWRNWMMDLYKMRRLEWISQAKGTVNALNGPDSKAVVNHEVTAKSGIELAREKYAATKANRK